MYLDPCTVADLFRRIGVFRHLYHSNGFNFLADELCDLTGFCVPLLTNMVGYVRIEYELGLTVIGDETDLRDGFLQNIEERRYVILPRVIPASHSLDMIVHGGEISEWMIGDMKAMMKKYCLESTIAFKLISENEDRYIEKLKLVLNEKFSECIYRPLLKKVRAI